MTERILDTDPLGTQENLQRLLEQTRRSRNEIYTPFSMEVMQERDLEDQKYKENYIREQTRLERQRQQTGSGPSSWTAPVAREIGSAIGGSGVALESMGGAIMRGFDPETSDWMVRNTQIYEAARAQGMEEDEELGRTRKEINEMIFSTSNSFAQAGAAGGMAYLTGGSSIGFMAATFAGTQANTSYVTARDHGLSVSDSAKFAGRQGAYEAGFMLMFQAIGLGGFEKYITGGSGAFASSTWKELGKVVGLHTLAELEEEELTTLFQTTSRVAALYPHEDAWTGEDGTFLTSEVFRDVVQTAKQTVFMMGVANTPAALKVAVGNSSRSSIKGLPQEAKDRMESEGIDTDKLEGRKDATTKTLEDYIEAREAKGQLTDDIRFFEQLVKDDSNSDEVREQADHIAISLRGEESTITPNEKIITQLVDKLGISSKPEVSPDIIAAPAGSDSVKTSVPQVILKQDPKAEIVDPLDLVSKTPEEDELVRILSVVKELNDSVRGGRRVSIVRTNDPNVRGVYDGDGIYVTEPRLRRYMKDGKLSSEGLRKAVAGTFAHEFDHELKLRNKNAWEELYALLSRDTKYGPILVQKEKDFRDTVEGSSGRKDDPYAAYKGEANKERLDELAKEESLSWLMDDHFITTGLVSKLAKNNSTSFEILRDWLRRLRNSLFGDKLYRGMVNVFNKVSTDLDLEPVDVKDVPARKRPARKRPKKSAKKRAKHKASRGLPEWAEGPVDKLEQRGAKVISKDYASETSVVVTVRSKAGAKRIVTLQVEPDPKTKLFTVVNKTSVSATAKNYDDKLAGAIEEATAYDGALIVQKAEDRRKITRERMASTPDPVREYATEMLAQPEDSGISGLTDELNDDLEKLFTGYKEGYKDEETTIKKTSIVPFSKKMESKKRSDSLGPYLTDADVKGMDIKGLISRGMAYKTNDGNYRLTGWGARVAAKEPMDRLGKFDEPEPAPVEPDPVEQVPIETAAGLEGLPREIVELRRYLGKEPRLPYDGTGSEEQARAAEPVAEPVAEIAREEGWITPAFWSQASQHELDAYSEAEKQTADMMVPLADEGKGFEGVVSPNHREILHNWAGDALTMELGDKDQNRARRLEKALEDFHEDTEPLIGDFKDRKMKIPTDVLRALVNQGVHESNPYTEDGSWPADGPGTKKIRISIGPDSPEATEAVAKIREMGSQVGTQDAVKIDRVRVEVDVNVDAIWLKSIQADKLGTGAGTRVMNRLKDVADKHGVPIRLAPRQLGETTVPRLEAWYKKLGFVEDRGQFVYTPAPEPPPFDPKFSLAMEDSLTDEEVSRMNTTLERAEFSLKNSKHEGKAQDLVEAVWDGHHTDSVVEWMRENRFKDLQQIIEGVWPSDPETMALHKEFNIDRHLISDLKVRLLMGEAPKRRATKQFGGLGDPHSEWKLVQARSAIPSPMEYRQLRESEVKLSLKYGDLNLPDNYASPKTQKHVDERTRGMVDMVETYGYLRTPKEIRSHIEVEVEGQVRFGEDPEGETDALLKKGADGHIFKDTDMVMISEAHARVLNKLNTTQLTKEERDKLQETGAKLATYEDESGTSWGQAGAFMRHRSESVRVKGQRAFRKALYSNSEKVKRAINRLKGRVLNGDRDAMRKVAALREKWQEELKSIEQKLTDKGWDLDQLDKYLGSSEAVDALVYDIRKLKEPLLTTFVNMQYELFINNILSGPLTQAANLISNAAFAAYEFGPKRIASSLMNEAELLLGLPMGDPLGPRVGELPHLYRHMAIGFYEGMKNFGRSIFYEEETFEKSLGIAKGRMKFGTEGRRKFIGGPGAWRSGGLRGKATAVAGRGVRFAGTTMLTALDVFQKTMNGHAEAAALAYRAAKLQGLKDGEVGQFMDSVMGDKSHPLWMQALETARFLTFQGEPSELAKGLVNIRSRQPGVRWLLPFVITPDNIFRTGVSYSPLGVFSWSEKGLYNSIRKGMKEGDWRGGEGQGVNEKVFQAVVAGSLVALMMGDDDEGMPFITGTNPPQPKFWAQEQRKDAIPAMSVRIGEGYVSYGRAEPFATLLALTKDLALALKTGKNPWSTTKKVSKSMVEVAKDKTYMRTVSDLGYLLSDPERGGIRMAEGFIVAAVPNWWRQGASARREHRPDRRTFWESEEEFEQWQRNMGRRMELPYGSEIFGYEEFPQIDQFGNKVPTGWNPFSGHKSDFWYNLLVPFRGKETHPGMGEKLLRRYNIQNPEKPFGIQKARYYFKVRGERRDLTKQEYREYGELSGEIFKALLDGEAVDVEEPTEAYIRDLWGSNVKLARKAAQKILLNKWAGLHDEAEVSVQEISGEILARNVSKRLTILARRKPRLSSQPPELRRKSMELRKRKLDEDVLVLQNSQKDAISWLATQGYTPEHIKKNIRIRNKGSILRRMKSLGGGAKDEGQRAISPRTGSAGRTARLQTGRLR